MKQLVQHRLERGVRIFALVLSSLALSSTGLPATLVGALFAALITVFLGTGDQGVVRSRQQTAGARAVGMRGVRGVVRRERGRASTEVGMDGGLGAVVRAFVVVTMRGARLRVAEFVKQSGETTRRGLVMVAAALRVVGELLDELG